MVSKVADGKCGAQVRQPVIARITRADEALFDRRGAKKHRGRVTAPDRGVSVESTAGLPGEVGKSLIGVGHAVDVFALGVGRTFALVRGEQFFGQLHVAGAALLFAHGGQ